MFLDTDHLAYMDMVNLYHFKTSDKCVFSMFHDDFQMVFNESSFYVKTERERWAWTAVLENVCNAESSNFWFRFLFRFVVLSASMWTIYFDQIHLFLINTVFAHPEINLY